MKKKHYQRIKRFWKCNNQSHPIISDFSFGKLVEFMPEDPPTDEPPNDKPSDIPNIDINCEALTANGWLMLLASRFLIINQGRSDQRIFLIFNHRPNMTVVEVLEEEDSCVDVDISSLDRSEENEDKRMTQFIRLLIGDDIDYSTNTYTIFTSPIVEGESGYLKNCWTDKGCSENGHPGGRCSWITFQSE